MTVDSDKLGVMVTGYNTLVPNLSASIISINAEITDLYEQWSALVYAENRVASDLQSYVTANKCDAYYTYGDYGVSGTGYLTEWMGFDAVSVTGLARVNAYYITVDGNQTGTFTAGTSAVFTTGIGLTTSTKVSGSVYVNPNTLVGFDDAIVPVGITYVFLESYANWGPLWDSDATVQGYMDDWVFLDDLMTKTLSSTGTYGIVDTIAKLGVAKALVLINMNKYNDATPILTTYAT